MTLFGSTLQPQMLRDIRYHHKRGADRTETRWFNEILEREKKWLRCEVEELFKGTTGNKANNHYLEQVRGFFTHLYLKPYQFGAAPQHHPDFPPEVIYAGAKGAAWASGPQGRPEKPVLLGGGS